MGITLGMGFDLSAKLFMDSRQNFATLLAMKLFPDNSVPEGFLTYCLETGLYYKFSSLNTTDDLLGKWRLFSSGVSSVEIDDEASSETSVYSSSKVEALFKEFGGYVIVSNLPTTDINIKKIYLKISNADGSSNVYDEYIYVQTVVPLTESAYTEIKNVSFTTYGEYVAGVTTPVTEAVFNAIRLTSYATYADYSTATAEWDWECIGSTEANTIEYNSAVPVNNPIGSIPSGWTTTGTSIQEMFDKILHKEILPTISFSCSEAGLKELDVSTVENPMLTVTINKGTCSPSSIQFYKDNVALGSSINYVNGTNQYSITDTGTTLTNTTVYKVIVTYVDESLTTRTLNSEYTYSFVLPYYYGVTATIPTDTTGLTKDLVTQSNRTYSFTGTSVYSTIFYDANYGNLTSIIDQNGFQCKTGFTKVVLSVGARSFNCYYTTLPATLSAFIYTFNK